MGGDRFVPRVSPAAWRALGLATSDLDPLLDAFAEELGRAHRAAAAA